MSLRQWKYLLVYEIMDVLVCVHNKRPICLCMREGKYLPVYEIMEVLAGRERLACVQNVSTCLCMKEGKELLVYARRELLACVRRKGNN